MALDGTDTGAIYGILDDDATRLLSRAATTVQTKVEAGHHSNILHKGPALRLLGCVVSRHESHYDPAEPIEKFKPRLVVSICAGAVFPEATAETETEALRKAVQTAVDACEIEEAASIEDRRAKLVELEQLARDPRSAKRDEQHSRYAGSRDQTGCPAWRSRLQ